jgi:hypothetical protein
MSIVERSDAVCRGWDFLPFATRILQPRSRIGGVFLLHIAKGKKRRTAVLRLSEAKSRCVLCNTALVLFRFRARDSNFEPSSNFGPLLLAPLLTCTWLARFYHLFKNSFLHKRPLTSSVSSIQPLRKRHSVSS